MFGGEDFTDMWRADAKLPDGLGAHEGQETLEVGGKSGGGHPTANECTTRRTLPPYSPAFVIQGLM